MKICRLPLATALLAALILPSALHAATETVDGCKVDGAGYPHAARGGGVDL